jgi:uncharacterized protein YaaW (UPF0174 family)
LRKVAYTKDADLEFLGRMNSADLNDLVHTLTHDRDGSLRWSEELTGSELYIKHRPDHRQYWWLVAAELQCFGANSFATMLRGGHGVLYREVLVDVCERLKVNFNAASTVDVIERNLLMKVLTDAIESMTPEQLRELGDAAGLGKGTNFTGHAMTAVFLAVFRAGGFKSYQLTVMVANAVLKQLIGRGLSFAGNAAVTRTMGVLAGPIGWAVTGLLTAIDLAGPAYRVTVPCVIQIAALRQKQLYEAAAGNFTL